MRIAVAGAGLGGLAAALALVRAGCEVTVFERAAALGEAGAGIQLSANATHVLRDLGVLPQVAGSAVRLERVAIRRWRDGAMIAQVPLGALAEARYGAPFFVALRADVQAALHEALAAEPRASIVFGATAIAFATTHDRVAVTVEMTGGPVTLAFDGLVGADGLRSAVRAALHPGAADAPAFSGRTAWRSLVPADAVAEPARDCASQLWLGPRAHLVHYPVRGGALINVVAILDRADRREAALAGWSTPGDPALIEGRLRHWDSAAQRLVAAAPAWRVWPLFERPPLRVWSAGPVTLVGDAAHPMLPFLAQGAAQALLDGWTLAHAVRASSSFAEAARLYEAQRRPVATRVQRDSARQGSVYHLAGPLALARDTAMAVLGPARMLSRYDWLYGPPAGFPPSLSPMV